VWKLILWLAIAVVAVVWVYRRRREASFGAKLFTGAWIAAASMAGGFVGLAFGWMNLDLYTSALGAAIGALGSALIGLAILPASEERAPAEQEMPEEGEASYADDREQEVYAGDETDEAGKDADGREDPRRSAPEEEGFGWRRRE
jgi:hypothetical protein